MLLRQPSILGALFASLLGFSSEIPAQESHKASEVLKIEGASVSSGFGTSLTMQERVVGFYESQDVTFPQGKRVYVSLDRFFPTRFDALTEEISDLEAEVNRVIDDLLQSHDVLILGVLSTPEFFEDVRTEYPDESEILEGLEKVSFKLAEQVDRVNRVLSTREKLSPDEIYLLSPEDFFSRILEGSFAKPSSSALSLEEAFVDQWHLSSLGQAALIEFTRPVLEQIFVQELPPMPIREATPAEVKAYGGSNLRSERESQRGHDDFYIEGLSREALLNPDVFGNLKTEAPDLALVMDKISEIGRSNIEAPRTRVEFVGETTIKIDLSAALSFTEISLVEDPFAPGEFVTYSADFWSSVDFLQPPRTTYEFRASVNADRTKIELRWSVLSGYENQPRRRIARVSGEVSRWIANVLNGSIDSPYIQYNFSFDLIPVEPR